MNRWGQSTRFSRRRLLVVGAGGMTAAFLAACGGGSDSSSSAPAATPAEGTAAATVAPGRFTVAPKTGRTREQLTVGVAGLPATLDAARELSNVGTRVTYSIYDMPLRRDFFDSNKLVSSLAVNRERVDDLTLVLKVREGVTLHNGEGLTAQDVAYTYNRLLGDPDLVEAKGYFDPFDKVEALDQSTVRIRTKAPDPLLEKRLASWGSWVVSRAATERDGGATLRERGAGAGPYKGTRLEPDNQLTLERHDRYWDEQPPARRVTFRVIPEVAPRVTALINNEAQIITNIPPDQVKTLRGDPNIELRDIPLANMHTLYYNSKHPILQSQKLRQAMNLAIDRQLLVDTLWNGRAVLTRGHQFEEYGSMYNPNRALLPHDAARAKALVAESGYSGGLITYMTSATYYTNGLQAAQAIIEMWKKAGVNAEVKLINDADRIAPETVMVRNHSNSSILADPDGSFWRLWGNANTIQRNFWTPADADFNRLGHEARSTLDEKRRYDNFQRMYDIWEAEAPGTALYIPVENYGVRKDVNWSPYPFYYMDLRAYNLSFSK